MLSSSSRLLGLNQHLARDGGGVVVLGNEIERDALGRGLAVVVQQERVAVHDLPLANGEDLDARRLSLGVGAEGVEGVLGGDGRLLAVANVGEGGELVAQLRSPLEVHLPGGLAHRDLAHADQTVHPPLEKGYDVGDDPVVLLLGDRPDARRRRAADVVVEARHPAAAAGLGSPALAEREGLVQYV